LAEIGVRSNAGERIVVSIDFASLLGTLGVDGAAAETADGTTDTATADAILALLGVDVNAISTGDVNAAELLQAIVDVLGLQDAVDLGAIPLLDTVPVDATAVVQGITTVLGSLVNLEFEATVVDEVDSPRGKWPTLLGNVVVLEASRLVQWLREQLLDSLNLVDGLFAPVLAIPGLGLQPALDGARVALADLDYDLLKQFALQVTVQYKERLDAYIIDSSNTQARMVEFSNSVMNSLGFDYFATTATPLAAALQQLRFIQLFLDVTFQTVVFILAGLSAVVVYALMLGDTEAKTYEYGMLRALGMQHNTLVMVLLTQTAAFALPGLLIGLTVAAVLFVLVAALIADFASADLSLVLPAEGWIYGVAYGLLVPAIATIGPIRRALSNTLRDALDLYRSAATDVTVVVLKLAEVGLSVSQTVVAVTLIVIGFVTYYLVPLSFVLARIDIFLAILNSILMAMVLGLAILSQTAQPCMERGVLTGMLCGRQDSRLQHLIQKNLSGHRSRNRKTSYIVSIATAFLLFAGAMVALQQSSIRTNLRNFIGADISVTSPRGPEAAALPQAELEAWLSNQRRPGGLVKEYTFVTYPMEDVLPATFTGMGNLVSTPLLRARLYGVQGNYLDATYADDFARATESTSAGVPNSISGGGGAGAIRGSSEVDNTAVVRALYAGAGRLALPVEGGTLRVPPTPVAGEGAYPLYICANLTAYAAGARGQAARAAINTNATTGSAQTPDAYATFDSCSQECSAPANGTQGDDLLCVHQRAVDVENTGNAAESSYREYVDLLISEATRDRASLDVETPILVRVTGASNDNTAFTRLSLLGKVRAMLQKFPGFFFSSYSQGARRAPVLMRMQDFGTTLLRTREALLTAIEQGTALSDAEEAGQGEGDDDSGDEEAEAGDSNGGGGTGDIDNTAGDAEVTRQPSDIPGISQFPRFLPSMAAWGQAQAAVTVNNGSVTVQSGRIMAPIAAEEGPLGSPRSPVVNASSLVDGDTSTLLMWRTGTSSAEIALDFGECPSVSGAQVWIPASSDPATAAVATEYILSGGLTLAGPWSTRGSVTVPPSASGQWVSTRFLPFSAQFWRVEVAVPRGGAQVASGSGNAVALAAAEVQFRLATAAVCEAETALSDDRALNIPKQRVMIAMPEGATEDQRKQVANALKSILRSDEIFVQDTQEILDSAESAIVGLTIFFNFVAILALVLAFFASWLSFTANVRENARELAVLRALGLTIHQVTRVYVYEALSVVLASFTGGAIVGILISITLTLQFNLFTEQPFEFIFPTSLFVLTFVLLVAVAVVSAYYPAMRIARVRIAQVLKGK